MLTELSQNWRARAHGDRRAQRHPHRALRAQALRQGVPVNVVLNEAIELAKRYGTAEGAAFVNGLLDRAVGELGIRR